MKLYNKTLGLILLLVIISKSNFSQQLTPKTNTETQIVCLFTTYSVEQDKLLHKEFLNVSDFKIIYSCIPAGIIVVESTTKISDKEKSSVKKMLSNIHASFSIIENLSLRDAEEKCTSFRSN